MLDRVMPWGSKVRAYRSPNVLTRPACEAWELRDYFALRRQIFVDEQAIFGSSDEDEMDAHAVPIVALSLSAGMTDEVVGIVRIYESTEGVWFGGRLGVRQDYRRHGIVGEKLIKTAVGTARGAGCLRFLATVQPQNERYFAHHHFTPLERVEICGRPHCLMEANLPDFAPLGMMGLPAAARGRAA